MSSSKFLAMVTAATALVAAAAPASAQYQRDPQRDRGRTGQVVDEVVRQIENAADAVARVDTALDGVRYGRAERFAIDRCAPRAEQYGEMRIDRVVPYGNRSLRVYGTAGVSRYGEPRRYGYARGGYGGRSFVCTVRDDGRVKFKTRRLRY